MYWRRCCSVMFVAAVAAGMLESVANADQPVPVVRTFGFLMQAPVDAQVPDFEGEDSIGVVVLPSPLGAVGSTIEFAACECNPEWLQGTVWRSHPACHVSKGSEKDSGVFFWLQTEECPDLPDVGAHTFNGSDSMILPPGAEVLSIAKCGACCGPGDSDKYYVTPPGGAIPWYFVVVTAVFSK